MKPRNPMQTAMNIKSLLPQYMLDEYAVELDKFIKDVYYKAPEQWAAYWNYLGTMVNDMVGPPPIHEGWQLAVVAELMEITVEEVKERFDYA